jgi:hypothetical protein
MHTVICLLLATAVGIGAGQAAPQPSKDSLAFLADLAGKLPSEARVFANPAFKARLSTLLGRDATLLQDRFQVESPIQKSADVVAFSGNKQHEGGSDDGLIVVNTRTNDLWVWMTIKGQLRHYGPDREPVGLPTDAATFLRTMRGK